MPTSHHNPLDPHDTEVVDMPHTPRPLPTVISDAIRATLDSLGLTVIRRADTQYGLDDERLDAVLAECGGVAAEAVRVRSGCGWEGRREHP